MARFILKKVLKRKKVSGNELARRLGRPFSNVARLLKEDYNPTLSTLSEVAAVLGVRVRDLIQEDASNKTR